MRCLLDTHVLIWLLAEPERILHDVTRLLSLPDHQLIASAVSRWEVAIKVSQGKMKLPIPFDDAVIDQGITILPVTWAHARAVADLPLLHRDPFDRLLVAQAIVEEAILVSSDDQVLRYPVRTLRASP